VVVGIQNVADTDGDGREQVPTEIVHMELTGMSSMGPVIVRVRDRNRHPNRRSTGEIEETRNTQSGRLDLPPFALTGTADSFFDVFFEVEVGGQVLHSHDPKRMRTIITRKPPAGGETYENPQVIELFTENENPAGVRITGAFHIPNPVPPIPAGTDRFPSGGRITFVPLQGDPETIQLSSEGLPDAIVERGPQTGNMINAEILSLELQGMSQQFGQVIVRIGSQHGLLPSTGRVMNIQQNPDGTFRSGDSFFDVFFEVEFRPPLGGALRARNTIPLRLSAQIFSLPPNLDLGDPCSEYLGQVRTALFAQGQRIGDVTEAINIPFQGVRGTACQGR
jgi:hypothetical protein